jgi:Cu/Ag efflux pump CusA
MAAAIMGGIIAGTIITLYFLPALCGAIFRFAPEAQLQKAEPSADPAE